MSETRSFIVGRQAEIELFDRLLQGQTEHQLLNIYGPGGIGKTVVGERMTAHAQRRQIPFALVDGNRSDLTPDRLLYSWMEGIVAGTQAEAVATAFKAFDGRFQEYVHINQILQLGGGVPQLFDVIGNLQDPARFARILDQLTAPLPEPTAATVRNRFALERYLRGVDRALTTAFLDGLATVVERAGDAAALVIDTYEELEGLDDWLCRTLMPGLPQGAYLVILGRNQVHQVNFDWHDYADAVHAMPLPELAAADAKAYLRHFGLTDPVALEKVYQFTGGYPLLLVLVRHLAREAGGWDQIGAMESSADRDQVATQLLARILRQESVAEVRTFLERGVVARWFDPETIGVLLEINGAEARQIYDKLRRHSFVERHPHGLKFHDKIRELLLERLKFGDAYEYNRLTQRLMNYYSEKAGIGQPTAEMTAAAPPVRATLVRQLRDMLAHLYTEETTIKRMGEDAGLSLAAITLGKSPLDNWYNVLAEAEKHHRTDALLQQALADYPDYQPLQTLAAQWTADHV